MYADINALLIQSLIDANIGVPIAYENAVFDPDSVELFAGATIIPGTRESMTKNGYGEVIGIMQVDVFSRKNSSVGASLSVVDKVFEFYTDNLSLQNDDTEVIILNRFRESPISNGPLYNMPVTIEFRARPKH